MGVGGVGLPLGWVALVEYLGFTPVALVRWGRVEMRAVAYVKVRVGDLARVFIMSGSVKFFKDGVSV